MLFRPSREDACRTTHVPGCAGYEDCTCFSTLVSYKDLFELYEELDRLRAQAQGFREARAHGIHMTLEIDEDHQGTLVIHHWVGDPPNKHLEQWSIPATEAYRALRSTLYPQHPS